MNNTEFREVLNWWMSSDPMPEGVNGEVINDWLERESRDRGYSSTVVAFHEEATRLPRS